MKSIDEMWKAQNKNMTTGNYEHCELINNVSTPRAFEALEQIAKGQSTINL